MKNDVDEKRTLGQQMAGGELNVAYEAPRNAVERAIAEIWQNLLNVERVGIHDNFLLLGGESLLANQIASRIRDRFAFEVPMESIFLGTVATIAAEIQGQLKTSL